MTRIWLGLCIGLLMAGPAGAVHPDDAQGELDAPPETPRPVFTLLIGQPLAPGLPPLSAVATDVAMMHAFFGALSPRHSYVHLPRGAVRARLEGPETSIAAPTWPAIRASLDALVDALDALDGRADVYVYYAGHGRKRRVGAHTRTDLFLHPMAGAAGAGEDGILSTQLLQREVLGRLGGAETRIHLLVDACQSAYLLESRGMRRTHRVIKAPPRFEPEMLEQFTGRYEQVGAVLATSGSQVTYESADSGGLFSYAMRTAGIGAADVNGDGLITYGELDQMLPSILSQRAGGAVPMMLAPGGRDDEPFVDYRGRQAATVTFSPEQATRYELQSLYREPYAALFPGGHGPNRVFLPNETRFVASARVQSRGPRVWSRFQAASGLFEALQTPLSESAVWIPRAADDLPPLVLSRPLGEEAYVEVDDVDWVWVPERYATLALVGHSEASVSGRTLGIASHSMFLGGEVSGAVGEGADLFTWRAGYSRWISDEPYGDGRTTHRRGDLPRAAAGYSRIFAELSLVELGAGVFGGGGVLYEDRWASDENEKDANHHVAPMIEAGAELSARVLIPDSVWAVRADFRVAGQQFFDDEGSHWFDVVAGATLGIEYEFVLR